MTRLFAVAALLALTPAHGWAEVCDARFGLGLARCQPGDLLIFNDPADAARMCDFDLAIPTATRFDTWLCVMAIDAPRKKRTAP